MINDFFNLKEINVKKKRSSTNPEVFEKKGEQINNFDWNIGKDSEETIKVSSEIL